MHTKDDFAMAIIYDEVTMVPSKGREETLHYEKMELSATCCHGSSIGRELDW